MLYLYTDLWMLANGLWVWLDRQKRTNWQCRGKPIWAAELWQDIAAQVEKLAVKVCHVDAHECESQAAEELYIIDLIAEKKKKITFITVFNL